MYLTQQALLDERGKRGSGNRSPSVNLGCLLPEAVVGMPCWLWSGSHRLRKKAPRTEGLTQAEVIPGLEEGCGQPGQHPVRHPIKPSVLCPEVRETAFAGGGGPCTLAVFFNLAPKFTQTMCSFSTEPWREVRETPHTAKAQLLFGDGAELPAAPVALIMRSCDLLRADCAAVSRALSSFNEDRILLGRNHHLPFYNGGSKA